MVINLPPIGQILPTNASYSFVFWDCRASFSTISRMRYKGNANISFACVEGESLLMSLAHSTAISSGSACTSASLEPSYVLRAIGVGEELAHTSLRFGIGRFTTEAEVVSPIEKYY